MEKVVRQILEKLADQIISLEDRMHQYQEQQNVFEYNVAYQTHSELLDLWSWIGTIQNDNR